MNLGGRDTNIQFIAGWIEISSNVEGFYSGPICVIVMVYWLPLILQVQFHAPRSHGEFGQLILLPSAPPLLLLSFPRLRLQFCAGYIIVLFLG